MKVDEPIIYETQYSDDNAKQINEEIRQAYADKADQEFLIDYPTVYIIDQPGKQSKYRQDYTVYVGETIDIQRRTLEHLNGDAERRTDWQGLKNANNAHMFVIGHKHFNKSLTLDIENRMMQYLSSVDAVSHLNNRRENAQRLYYTEDEFVPIFNKIWDTLAAKKDYKYLFPARKEIENSAIFKASPFNKLTQEQNKAKDLILQRVQEALDKNETGKLILVTGDAGAGKTVLMSNVYYDLAKLTEKNGNKISLAMMVNHDEQLKVYQQIAKKLGIGDEKSVLKPASFINHYSPDDPVDVAFVDEAHLLRTQKNQGYTSDTANMLTDIRQRAKIVVAIYDKKQVLSKTQVWQGDSFQELIDSIGEENIIHLHNQMRIDAEPQTIEWLNNVINKGLIDKVPEDGKYEIKVFKKPQDMQKAIQEKNDDQNSGISRMVATYDWEYSSQSSPQDGSEFWQVSEGDWKMPWNYQVKKPRRTDDGVSYKELSWAQQPVTIDEIGSTYTVQGFDLNYVGVEIGPSVKLVDGKIVHVPAESCNKDAVQYRTFADGTKENFAEDLLTNELNVLLTRGVHGLYLHAVDPALQQALEEAAGKDRVVE